MSKIKCILIDDDGNLRKGLSILLEKYHQVLEIIDEADGVESGLAAISRNQPDVIFLDVRMGDGTGFDLLEKIKNSSMQMPQVVFITAHEEYAIKAFRFSALDFLLKPVDLDDLDDVIAKIVSNNTKHAKDLSIELLLENIKQEEKTYDKLILRTQNTLNAVLIDDIIRCESDSNYTHFFLINQEKITISKTLKEYEDLLSEHHFIRTHQSHLINLKYVKDYDKKPGLFVWMSDGSKIPVSKRKKDFFLQNMDKKINHFPNSQ